MPRGRVSWGWHANDTAVSHADHGGFCFCCLSVCQSVSQSFGLVVACGDWRAAAEALSGRGCSTAIMHDRRGDETRLGAGAGAGAGTGRQWIGGRVHVVWRRWVGWVEPTLALRLAPCALCLVPCSMAGQSWIGRVVGYRLAKAWIHASASAPVLSTCAVGPLEASSPSSVKPAHPPSAKVTSERCAVVVVVVVVLLLLVGNRDRGRHEALALALALVFGISIATAIGTYSLPLPLPLA
jgi:hypothetical protein